MSVVDTDVLLDLAVVASAVSVTLEEEDAPAGDDTPGSVYWTTIYSRTDGVMPTSASKLDGGACHVEVGGVERGRRAVRFADAAKGDHASR